MSLFPMPSPTFPSFSTLLMKGPYHPSAPIHLLLSHAARSPTSRCILFTPSRDALLSSMRNFSDHWLTVHGGDGQTCHWSSRVDIFYPSTTAHLVLLVSMLHRHDGSFYHPRTTVRNDVSLVVLHEPSSYLPVDDPEATVSSYLSLISQVFAMISSLSANSSTRLALFDLGLDRLKLPILRPVSPDPELSVDTQGVPHTPKHDSVALFVEKYFEWIGVMEAEIIAPPTPPDMDILEKDGTRTMCMRLYRREEPSSEIIYRWIESPTSHGRVFTWLQPMS